MKAVVTGAAGFIGCRTSLALLDAGWTVVGIDHYDSLAADDIRSQRAQALTPREGFTAATADISVSDLSGLIAGADLVVHLAALPGVRPSWEANFTRYAAVNVGGTQRVIDAVAKHAADARVVLASSSSVYGDHTVMPLVESAPLLPSSPYGITKVAAEHVARLYAQEGTPDVVCARFFTVCGPGQRPDMGLSRIIASAQGGPAFTVFNRDWTRDYTHVDDAVDAILALAGTRRLPLLAYNIAGGHRASIPEVAAMVEAELGAPPNLIDTQGGRGDVIHTWADGSAIKRDAGWAPRRSLADAIRAQIADPTGTSAGREVTAAGAGALSQPAPDDAR